MDKSIFDILAAFFSFNLSSTWTPYCHCATNPRTYCSHNQGVQQTYSLTTRITHVAFNLTRMFMKVAVPLLISGFQLLMFFAYLISQDAFMYSNLHTNQPQQRS